MKMPNRTKVVATLGPASSDEKTITELIQAGVNVFRLNCSHADHELLTKNVRNIRKAAKKLDQPIGILGDLQGPKIRVGALQEPIEITPGQPLIITTKPNYVGAPPKAKETAKVGTGYEHLATDVKAGEQILLDDGNLELIVVKVEGPEVHCKVVHGGLLKPFKGINLPGSKVSAEALTPKDRRDLDKLVELGVDFVALSFVRTAADVLLLTDLLAQKGSSAKVISKLERPEVVDHLDAIIDASYGVMVARGDMGVELGPEAVPALQKRIITKSVAACKPVITATQMLESMITNPRPTRAEVSDVANAILDGSSAVMLSGETAAGKYPVRTVEIMSSIIRTTEREHYKDWTYSPNWRTGTAEVASVPRATVHAAARGALEAGAKAIAVFTESGFTARYLSGERLPVPTIVFTPNDSTLHRMALAYGIIPRKVKTARTSIAMTVEGERTLIDEGFVTDGDRVVMVFGSSRSPGLTNIVNIRVIGDEPEPSRRPEPLPSDPMAANKPPKKAAKKAARKKR